MSSLLDICHQCTVGERIPEQSFDLDRVYAILKGLVNKYDLKYDPDNPVPADDSLADRVFEAAVEFFVACGVFCKDTGRIVRFTQEEVLHAVANYDGNCSFGEGKEARVFRSRKPDDNTRPWCHVGSGIVASTEEIAFRTVQGYASIAAADSMSVPALSAIAGAPFSAGTPQELLAAIRSIQIARDACRQAGRPGLPIINGIATAGTALATIAASNPQFGLRASDGWIAGSLAEMKTNWEMLCKIAYLTSAGGNIVLASAPFLGGYGGGPEATAVLNTAYVFFGILVYQCNYFLSLPMHIRVGTSSTRDTIWATALSSQAISRNTNVPTLTLAYVAGGPWTESFFYESAACIAASVASGVSTQTPHPAKALLPDHVTPLEMQTTVEIQLACTGMTRKEANQIVGRLLPRYEDGLLTASAGRPYVACFDPASGQAKSEYLDFVAQTKKELAATGISV